MRKIIIVGPGASGKDYLFDYLSKHFTRGIKTTTRPKRDGEINGYTYHYTDNEKFIYNIYLDDDPHDILIWQHFEKQDWYYGYTRKELDTKKVFIMTPYEINTFYAHLKNPFIIYMNIPRDIRKKRLLNRSDEDSIKNRLESDDKSFQDFDKYDIQITDPEFNCDEIFMQILDKI